MWRKINLYNLNSRSSIVWTDLDGWLILADGQLTVSASCGLAASYVFQLVLLTLDKAIIGKLPPVRICFAKALHKSACERLNTENRKLLAVLMLLLA